MSRLNECKSNWTTNAKPGLVEKWEVSADSKTWTFKLRPNVKFHDGTPFDADAVVFNFQRWMDAKNPYHKSGDFTYWHDLERNNDYWDKANMPKLDKIVFRVIKDNTARFLELKAGTIQGMEGLNPDDVAAAQKDPNLKIQLGPAMNVAYLAFNFTNQYLAKKEVRQAIAYAINRQGDRRRPLFWHWPGGLSVPTTACVGLQSRREALPLRSSEGQGAAGAGRRAGRFQHRLVAYAGQPAVLSIAQADLRGYRGGPGQGGHQG